MNADLARLVALSPRDDVRINALVRSTCARALSLPPLPAEVSVVAPESAVESAGGSARESAGGSAVESARESAVVDFAEQFSVDVTGISDSLRGRLLAELGGKAFRAVVLMYVADFVPRVRAGLSALGLDGGLGGLVSCDFGPVVWDHESDPAEVVFNEFLPAVARLRLLDPLTAEVVRLRGATQHQCRLCKSLREGAALDAGGSEVLYGDIERYEMSDLLTDRQKATLRYVDALIWSPAAISVETAAGVRAHFSDDEAVELTLDVMRNASNKIAVAFAADTPRVESGTEVYRVLADGQLEYS